MSTVVTEGGVGTVSPGLWDGTSGEDPVLAQAVCAKGEGACGDSISRRGRWSEQTAAWPLGTG